MGLDDTVRRFGLLGRFVRGRVRARSDAVLEYFRLSNMQRKRHVGLAEQLHQPSMRKRLVHRRLHARGQTMQRAHSADLRQQRDMGERVGMPERVHGRQLHGVHAGRKAVQPPAAADVRRGGELAEHDSVHQPGLCGRQLRRHLHAERDPMRAEQRRNVLDERDVG
jgi:hypothetical protein